MYRYDYKQQDLEKHKRVEQEEDIETAGSGEGRSGKRYKWQTRVFQEITNAIVGRDEERQKALAQKDMMKTIDLCFSV